MGFDGFQWHTHGDLLASDYAQRSGVILTPDAAVDRFVRDILDCRTILVVSRRSGEVTDIRVTESPIDDLKYKLPDETLEFRYWDGTLWRPA